MLKCTVDFNPSAPGELVWFQDGQEMHRENSARNVWTKTLTKADNNGVFVCQLQHKTLQRWKWSMLSCEEEVVLNVQYSPHVSVSGSQTEILEGDTYNARCKVIDANPDEILLTYWIGPHGKIADNATLMLWNVTRDQRGDYTCVMVNEFYNGEQGNGTASVMVDVQYLSKIALTVSPLINATVNDEITINCTVLDSNPKPYELRFSLDGNIIAEDFGPSLQYLIPSAKANDSGTYKCQAFTLFYNGVEEYSLSEYTIVIRYSPTITIANTRVTADIGDTVELECSVNSLPPSVVSWYDPGNDVISNKEDRNEDDTVTSRVAIIVEDESYYGIYTCQADNGIPPIARQTIELAKSVSSSTIAIAVGVAGGGLFVILLFVLIFCCYRLRSNKISKVITVARIERTRTQDPNLKGCHVMLT
ncbi:cell adhesion molecule CEACAM6-like [Ptychodera flava]|uniref:cell adhesion molecule CEACAM6-like n=1 Tax=Ptychodera flava TaxID=63121 RepID=UPI00396A4B1C